MQGLQWETLRRGRMGFASNRAAEHLSELGTPRRSRRAMYYDEELDTAPAKLHRTPAAGWSGTGFGYRMGTYERGGGVGYAQDGRLFYPASDTSSNPGLVIRDEDDTITEYRHGVRVQRGAPDYGWRTRSESPRRAYYDYDTSSRSISSERDFYYTQQEPVTAPMMTMVPAMPGPEMTYGTTVIPPAPVVVEEPPPPRSYSPPRRRRRRGGYLPRKPRAWNIDRPMVFTFIICGIFILICALINMLFCVNRNTFDYLCRWWSGILVLLLGILGFIHRSDYYRHWKTYAYVLCGVITTIACFAATAIVLETMVQQIKDIARNSNIQNYIGDNNFNTDSSIVKIPADVRIWLCLISDWVFLTSLITCYYALLAAVEVANSHYNVHYHYDRNFYECDPYCHPRSFNPWVQVPLSMAVIFIGMLSLYVAEGTDWIKYWTPVIAGVVAIIGGTFAGASRKRPDRIWLTLLGILFQIITVIMCIVAMAFMILAIIDIVNAINNGNITDEFNRRVYISGAVMLAICALGLLVLAIYAMAVIIPLFIQLIHRDRYTDPRDERYERWSDSYSTYSDKPRSRFSMPNYAHPYLSGARNQGFSFA